MPFSLAFIRPRFPTNNEDDDGTHTFVRIRNPSHSARGMGLLDQLWDETVAGPRPDHGLGKLRKYSSFSPSSSSLAADVAPAVTRSITIARPTSLSVLSGKSSSVPSSPLAAATTTPRGGGWRTFRRKSKMAGVGEEAAVGPRSPTVYDWVVISSLDR